MSISETQAFLSRNHSLCQFVPTPHKYNLVFAIPTIFLEMFNTRGPVASRVWGALLTFCRMLLVRFTPGGAFWPWALRGLVCLSVFWRQAKLTRTERAA